MKKLFTFIIIISLLSCKSKKDKIESPKEGEAKILARVTERDSSRQIYWMVRVIKVDAVFDSTEKKHIIKIDTVWGKPVTVPKKDSTGAIMYDNLKNPIPDPIPVYVQVNKDSVEWRVANIPMDTLLKKR